jgi:hypothetical protein
MFLLWLIYIRIKYRKPKQHKLEIKIIQHEITLLERLITMARYCNCVLLWSTVGLHKLSQ